MLTLCAADAGIRDAATLEAHWGRHRRAPCVADADDEPRTVPKAQELERELIATDGGGAADEHIDLCKERDPRATWETTAEQVRSGSQGMLTSCGASSLPMWQRHDDGSWRTWRARE